MQVTTKAPKQISNTNRTKEDGEYLTRPLPNIKITKGMNLTQMLLKMAMEENIITTYVGTVYLRGISVLEGSPTADPMYGRTGTAYIPPPWLFCS